MFVAAVFRRPHPWGKGFRPALWLAALWLVAGAGEAAADSFTVRHVPVDVAAGDAAAARDQALVLAQKRGFDLLLRRMTLVADVHRLPDPEGVDLTALVRGLDIEEEKTSNVRYIARLTITFRAEPIRAMLRERGIPFAETRSKPVLVLPVLTTGDAPALWDTENRWFAAWADRPRADFLVSFLLPLFDAEDMETVTPDMALAGDSVALGRLARRYDAGSVLVAAGRMSADGAVFQLTGGWYGMGDRTVVEEIPAGPDGAANFAEGVRRLTSFVEEGWKTENLLRYGADDEIVAVVPIETLEGWNAIRRTLAGVAPIRSTALISLSRYEARILIKFAGALEQLAIALRQSDLELRQTGGVYMLGRASAGRNG